MMSNDEFTEDQKQYLQGLATGIQVTRASAGLKPMSGSRIDNNHKGPDSEHLDAMARFERDGKKLVNEEKAKRDEHPFDAYARLKREAEGGQYPKGVDNFRWRFHGLFYVAPAQDSFMCRLRIPNGIVSAWQFSEVADLADAYGGGYAHVTTRANLQIREIKAENAPSLVEGLAGIGLNPKGSGADNIRNVTGSATAGIDPNELIDTRKFAKDWHHFILNHRVMYGLPRKFNVAFDGGGMVPTLEDTNDIAFTAVFIKESAPVEPGVWFRLGLGGITGHRDFARSTGIYVKPNEATEVAAAIVHVFIKNGDRSNRQRARLKYVLDEWGFDKFLDEVEKELGRQLCRIEDEHIELGKGQNRLAHIGAHPQRQEGLCWVGVGLEAGHLSSEQIRALARISREFGDGDIRLTVWQNLLLSGVRNDQVNAVEEALQNIGLTSKVSNVRAGLVSCTGNTGCKFAASNTKGTASAIANWLDDKIDLDTPINIHITGCHHSCAQHYIGDLGLIACRVPLEDGDDDTVEGFHIFVGGGFGAASGIGRELYTNVRKEDCPRKIELILKAYLESRTGEDETFVEFARRHDIPKLQSLLDQQEAM